MNDPHLNSIHLPAPRRERFRQARAALVGSAGQETMAGSLSAAPDYRTPERTDADGGDRRHPSRFVLVDRDHIFPLKVGINTVGRLPDNDVVVADPYVSRRHVAIVVHAHGGCELHDVASKNGTLVNGRGIDGATPLHSGDQIRLSDHTLVFQRAGDGRPVCDLENTLVE